MSRSSSSDDRRRDFVTASDTASATFQDKPQWNILETCGCDITEFQNKWHKSWSRFIVIFLVIMFVFQQNWTIVNFDGCLIIGVSASGRDVRVDHQKTEPPLVYNCETCLPSYWKNLPVGVRYYSIWGSSLFYLRHMVHCSVASCCVFVASLWALSLYLHLLQVLSWALIKEVPCLTSCINNLGNKLL